MAIIGAHFWPSAPPAQVQPTGTLPPVEQPMGGVQQRVPIPQPMPTQTRQLYDPMTRGTAVPQPHYYQNPQSFPPRYNKLQRTSSYMRKKPKASACATCCACLVILLIILVFSGVIFADIFWGSGNIHSSSSYSSYTYHSGSGKYHGRHRW